LNAIACNCVADADFELEDFAEDDLDEDDFEEDLEAMDNSPVLRAVNGSSRESFRLAACTPRLRE
jgi:hypothetical protein